MEQDGSKHVNTVPASPVASLNASRSAGWPIDSPAVSIRTPYNEADTPGGDRTESNVLSRLDRLRTGHGRFQTSASRGRRRLNYHRQSIVAPLATLCTTIAFVAAIMGYTAYYLSHEGSMAITIGARRQQGSTSGNTIKIRPRLLSEHTVNSTTVAGVYLNTTVEDYFGRSDTGGMALIL